ncbi:hypothetical protein PoB_003227900 [Plakobranchus ocellatus]|uniref:Uncharacterized protein n=1 Tax=Plakobranchus ocellatus TaxID=259542 RepID=A0AAV4AHP2_9GAST|nr:hypothetical protein PoB_003227900 [Plakobranchus ocellatus]
MSRRNSRVNGTKSRKVRIASKAHPRPATPTVPPIPDPSRRHGRARQDKVVTAIRTFKDTARPIQPFPRRHPFKQRTGKLCRIRPLPPSRLPRCPCQAFSRPIAPPLGERRREKKAPPSGEKIKIGTVRRNKRKKK